MGRMKVGIALAGVAVALLGVVAAVTMSSDGSSDATTVASERPVSTVAAVGSTVAPGASATAAATAPATTSKPSGATATKAPSTTAPATSGTASTVPRPSVQEIQQLIAGIQTQITAPSATPGSTTPLTAAQIEARIRQELKTKYGITL